MPDKGFINAPSVYDYLAGHKASGIKAGDWVRVLRKAEDHESGWNTAWLPTMDRFIGKKCRVHTDNELNGFILEDPADSWSSWSFPYTVLEKVEQVEPWTPKVDSDAMFGDTTVFVRDVYRTYAWVANPDRWDLPGIIVLCNQLRPLSAEPRVRIDDIVQVDADNWGNASCFGKVRLVTDKQFELQPTWGGAIFIKFDEPGLKITKLVPAK